MEAQDAICVFVEGGGSNLDLVMKIPRLIFGCTRHHQRTCGVSFFKFYLGAMHFLCLCPFIIGLVVA
jgi:hypothetical protein